MAPFKPGLVHTPVTPFTNDGRIDYETYGKLIEFHLEHGAESLALPMHAGESVSLTDAERRELLEFALKQVKGRVPVIAHASQSGTGIAAEPRPSRGPGRRGCGRGDNALLLDASGGDAARTLHADRPRSRNPVFRLQ